jgi:hypothetical protein
MSPSSCFFSSEAQAAAALSAYLFWKNRARAVMI